MVKEQKFRSDLYRLNVFPIRVPALRERPEDIPPLVRHYVREFSRQPGKTIDTIPTETMTRYAFVCTGSLGVIWLIPWLLTYRTPRETIAPQEASAPPASGNLWREILQRRSGLVFPAVLVPEVP